MRSRSTEQLRRGSNLRGHWHGQTRIQWESGAGPFFQTQALTAYIADARRRCQGTVDVVKSAPVKQVQADIVLPGQSVQGQDITLRRFAKVDTAKAQRAEDILRKSKRRPDQTGAVPPTAPGRSLQRALPLRSGPHSSRPAADFLGASK